MNRSTHEDQSATQTLDIQFEIEPLPHGRFRGSEGIVLDWQDMCPFVWGEMAVLASQGMSAVGNMIIDMTIQQDTNCDGDATGEIAVLKASITNDKETRELDTGGLLVGHLLGDPCVTEAIWAAAEEKHRFG